MKESGEVTDIKEAIEGDNVEVIYSTFDELPNIIRYIWDGHYVQNVSWSIIRCQRSRTDSITSPQGHTTHSSTKWTYVIRCLHPAAFICQKRFFAQPEIIWERAEALPFLQQHSVDTEVRWTTLCSRSLAEPELVLTANFPKRVPGNRYCKVRNQKRRPVAWPGWVRGGSGRRLPAMVCVQMRQWRIF